jgi:lipopolysaccharide/colanic/teichoic acid biosynthesis glycosyltransferase
MDLIIASLLLILCSPIFLLLAILTKLDSAGPVFFRQIRLGKEGRPFEMIKFRTMYPGAETNLEILIKDERNQKLTWAKFQKLWDDPRLTRIGRILRRYSLDELPQLWNVIKGDMSLVGPRPILPEQGKIYGPNLSIYQLIRPGMTGAWQVNGRNLTSFEERVDWDTYYIRNWSLWMDIQILFRTVGKVLTAEGAF